MRRSNLTRRQFLGAAGAFVAAAPYASAFAQVRRMTVGTTPPGSLYFTFGSGFARALTERMGVQAIVQPYAGVSTTLPLVDNGEVTCSLASTLDSGAAYRGEGEWEGRSLKNLRALVRVYALPYTFTVRADSGLKTVADLKGKRVVTEFKAFLAMKRMNETLLRAGGLDLSDITPITVAGIKQGLDAVADNVASASAVAAGVTLVREMHASLRGGIRYLDVTGPNATDEFMGRMLPGTSLMRLEPNPRMPEVTEPITIGTYDAFLIVSADLSDSEAQKMTEVLIESWPELQKDYPALRSARQEELSRANNTVPYHPGAIAAFKARNMWTERNEEAQRKVM